MHELVYKFLKKAVNNHVGPLIDTPYEVNVLYFGKIQPNLVTKMNGVNRQMSVNARKAINEYKVARQKLEVNLDKPRRKDVYYR